MWWHSVKSGNYPPLFKDVYIWFDKGSRASIGRWMGDHWLCVEINGIIYDGVIAWQHLPEPYVED